MSVDWEGFNPDEEPRPRTRLGYMPIPNILPGTKHEFFDSDHALSAMGVAVRGLWKELGSVAAIQTATGLDRVASERALRASGISAAVYGDSGLRARDPLPQDDA